MAASSEQQVTVNPKLPTWSGDWSTWADYRMSVEFEQDSTAEDDLKFPSWVPALCGT